MYAEQVSGVGPGGVGLWLGKNPQLERGNEASQEPATATPPHGRPPEVKGGASPYSKIILYGIIQL